MQSLDFLGEMLAVLGASLAIVLLCQRIRIPSVVGFLVSGAIVGPSGLGIIADEATIEGFAEIGVVLLLFTVGLELSLRELWRMRKVVLLGGGAQMSLTVLLAVGVCALAGLRASSAIFFGLLISLSSTALVLTILTERGETGSPQGRIALSILIFQDLAVVPLMLLVPWLAASGGSGAGAGRTLGIAVLASLAAFLVAARFFPPILDLVARSRRREVFTIAVVLAALGTAYLTGKAGLSLALGSFLAGLVIAESKYGSQVLAEILPFKDLFNSVFFISVGMLASPKALVDHPLVVAGTVIGVVILKGFVLFGVTVGLGFGPRVATLVGLSLSQVGEFSFVLAHLGAQKGLLDKGAYQLFILVTVLTLAITPGLMGVAAPLAARIGGIGWLQRLLGRKELAQRRPPEHQRDHVVVCGYGLNGRSVTRVLRRLGVPHVVVELNPALATRASTDDVPVIYGDATRRTVLEHVHFEKARALVITIEDRAAARQIITVARTLNAHAYVLARTRYVSDVSELRALGASEVVPEELEASLELGARVMGAYGASPSAIFVEKELVRRDGYRILFDQEVPVRLPTLHQLLTRGELVTMEVAAGSAVAGRTLADLALPRRHGITVLSVQRADESMVNPPPDLALRARRSVGRLRRARRLARGGRSLRPLTPRRDPRTGPGATLKHALFPRNE
jgi:CPA2 family monovalent cation:H+ antiporter-2